MKRGTIIVCVFISILLINVVSAFSFGDFWNKITGSAIAEIVCNDSDGGRDYYQKGDTNGQSVFAEDGVINQIDYCIQKNAGGSFNLDNSLKDPYSAGKITGCGENCAVMEYYCAEEVIVADVINCQGGCENGACTSEITCPIDTKKCGDGAIVNRNPENDCRFYSCPTCIDLDGGKDYFSKSSTKSSLGGGLNDDCVRDYVNGKLANTGELLEAVCSGSKTEYIHFDCLNGCENGACLAAEEEEEIPLEEPEEEVIDEVDSELYSLVYDEDSELYIEKIVLDKINEIRSVCNANCDNLPQPVVSLDNGNQEAIYNLYLNSKKVTRFVLPFPQGTLDIISNPKNVLSQVDYLRIVNGTNSIKFLISQEGAHFQNRYDLLKPDEETNIKYEIVKRKGQYGSAYFFVLEDDEVFDLDSAIQIFDNVARDHSNLAGLEKVDPYYVIAMPSIFAILLGGEGNFYMSQHLITMNYGGEKNYELYYPNILMNEQAHEYGHGLQETLYLWEAYNAPAFLMEGMTDASSIYNGYRTWEDLGMGEDLEPGCLYITRLDSPHEFGRCLFKHLDQENYLDDGFFYNLFNPQLNYSLRNCSIDSEGYFSYDVGLQRPNCVNELNILLSDLTGEDMSLFMKEELLANVSLDYLRENLATRSKSSEDDEECTQIGYRKDGKYCLENMAWVDQKESDAICENNFECLSNVCVNNECIDAGLFETFINWIGNLFG